MNKAGHDIRKYIGYDQFEMSRTIAVKCLITTRAVPKCDSEVESSKLSAPNYAGKENAMMPIVIHFNRTVTMHWWQVSSQT